MWVVRKWYEIPRGFTPDENWYARAEEWVRSNPELEATNFKDKLEMAAYDTGWAYGQRGNRFYQKLFRAFLLLAEKYGMGRVMHEEWKAGVAAGGESGSRSASDPAGGESGSRSASNRLLS